QPSGSGAAEGSASEPPQNLAPSGVRPRRGPGSVAWDFVPGDRLVDAGLTGQAEDLLAEDVAHDLRRAALDRVRPHPQERVSGAVHRAGHVEVTGASERVV